MKHINVIIKPIILSLLFLAAGCSSDQLNETQNTIDQQIRQILGMEKQQSDSNTGNPGDTDQQQQENDSNDQDTEAPPDKEEKEQPERNIPELYKNIVKEVDGRKVLVNPENLLSVVNKLQSLPADYEPEPLVIPDVPFPFTEELPKRFLREDAARALEKLIQTASSKGVEIMAVSGYRSYDRQSEIFLNKASNVGEEEANQLVAYPGESEHQTGLAMDVSSPDFGYRLEEEFGETEAGKWLENHAHSFGFIIRYPKGKENITGYEYEPWHLRYVGKEAALEIVERNMTLEEYMGIVTKS